MKKFTYLMSLLLAFVGATATAQTYTGKAVSAAELTNCVKNVGDINPDSYYVLHCKGRGGRYVTLDPSDRLLRVTSSLPTDRSSMFAVFKIESVEEDGQTYYTFKVASSPAGQEYYIPAVGKGGQYKAGTDAAKYSINNVKDATDGSFIIKLKGSNVGFNCDDATFTGWDDEGTNSQYQLVPVTLGGETYTNYAVTYSIKVGEEVKESGASRAWGGDTFADPSVLCSYYFSEPVRVNPSNVIEAGNTDFVYTSTRSEVEAGAIPVFSTASSKTWYALRSQNSDSRILIAVNENATYGNDESGKVWHVKTEGNKSFNAATLTSLNDVYAASWAFIEDGLGVKIYNKQAGKYVKCSNDGMATLEDNGTRFYFCTSTNGSFSLWNGSGSQYLGSHSRYESANQRLGLWGGGDQNNSGSAFGFAGVDVSLAVQYATADLAAKSPNESNASYLTAGLAADLEAATTALTAAASYEAIDAALANLYVVSADVDANAYYRIGNANLTDAQKKYVSTENIFVGTDGVLATSYNKNNSIDRVVRRVPATGNFASMLWKLESNGNGTFKVRKVNTGCNLSDYVGSGIDMPINVAVGGSYTFKAVPAATFSGNDGKTMLQILVDGRRINAFQGNSNNIICDYNGNHDNDKGNYWQLEKVTAVPVQISDALYATVSYPFPVQVDQTAGVTAYYATHAEGGKLTLAEYANGIIPAGQGAILAATEAKSVNLAILSSAAPVEGNILQGAAAKRIGFAACSNYFLGMDADSKVKFLLGEITTVPANKAYLPVAYVSSTGNALAFDFEGAATAIATPVADDAQPERYFDLQGRPVLFPSNGVFITNTGKKVFIK